MGGMVRAGLALAAGLALWVAPAAAQIASQPIGENGAGPRTSRQGIYLGLGGYVGVQIATGADAKLSLGGQAKLGYALNRAIQIYLAGAVHNASYDNGFSQQAIVTTAHLHHFLYQDRSGLGVFYDAGIGIGFASPGFGPLGKTGIGLAYSGGLGVEIPLTRYLSLVPEFYYRSVNSSSEGGITGTIQLLGLQLGVVYY